RRALAALLSEWDRARGEHGLHGAVMIAADNATRARLNDKARARLIHDGRSAADAIVIADREFRVGERVTARRNNRYRGVDNGMCATVRAVDRWTGSLTVEPDGG